MLHLQLFAKLATGACAGESGMSDADGIDPVG